MIWCVSRIINCIYIVHLCKLSFIQVANQNIKNKWNYLSGLTFVSGNGSCLTQETSSGQLMILAVFIIIDLWPDVEVIGRSWKSSPTVLWSPKFLRGFRTYSTSPMTSTSSHGSIIIIKTAKIISWPEDASWIRRETSPLTNVSPDE